MKTNLSRSIDS